MAVVEIAGIGGQGEGSYEDADGLTQFVASALPGDRYDPASQAIEPISPHRQAPHCSHFTLCGGCLMQHADDAFVANWKLGNVKSALQAHGLAPEFRPVETSPQRSRRRVVLTGRRTKKTTQIGFHARRSDQLVPIEGCVVADPAIIESFPLCHDLIRLGASRSGTIKIALTASLGGVDIAVSEAKALDLPKLSTLTEMLQKHRVARLTWNEEVLMREAPAHQRFGAGLVEPPPGAFLQATPHGEQVLQKAVREGVGDAASVVDLFAGCGTFSLPLAEQAEVLAVEGIPEMLKALDEGWRKSTGLKSLRTEVRDLFRRPLLSAELNKYEAVVIDPPRAGAAAQMVEIAGSKLERVASVSCNPATFARDAKTLCDAGFDLSWVQVVDQFRWSQHVEIAAKFTR